MRLLFRAALSRLLTQPPRRATAFDSPPNPAGSEAPWRLYNVGNSQPVDVDEVARFIEEATGRRAIREYLPLQPGDVLEACADCSDLERAVDFRPNTPLQQGIRLFVDWFQASHGSQPARRTRV